MVVRQPPLYAFEGVAFLIAVWSTFRLSVNSTGPPARATGMPDNASARDAPRTVMDFMVDIIDLVIYKVEQRLSIPARSRIDEMGGGNVEKTNELLVRKGRQKVEKASSYKCWSTSFGTIFSKAAEKF